MSSMRSWATTPLSLHPSSKLRRRHRECANGAHGAGTSLPLAPSFQLSLVGRLLYASNASWLRDCDRDREPFRAFIACATLGLPT